MESFVYIRKIEKCPDKIVQNGKIYFGTFKGVSEKLDIRGVRSPFAGIPTDKFFSNFRIKSRVSYFFEIEKYIGLVEFFDDKVFGLAEVIFWDKETNKKLAYHKFMGPRKKIIPTNTIEAACTSFGKTRYIRISWNRRRKNLSLAWTVRGDKFRPAAKAKFYTRLDAEKENELLTVSPAPVTRRCSATWFVASNILGGISMARHRRQIKGLPQDKGQMLMITNRIYLRWHSTSELLVGFFEVDGKTLSFTFSKTNQSSLDEDKYNENMLCFDGKITALPPVCITHPFGINKKWIIQDTESMVDLYFEPISVSNRTLNIIIMRNAYTTIYGNFEGTLLTKDGESIILKKCAGIAKKSMLRL